MGVIRGERSIEIVAPLERCFQIAADLDRTPTWMESMRDVEVFERDPEGRALLVETRNDAKIKMVTSRLRFSYHEAPHAIHWTQEKGEVKSLRGWWRFQPLHDGVRTHATYGLEVDPGRILGMLIRGPVEGQVREFLLGDAAEGLKRRAESA